MVFHIIKERNTWAEMVSKLKETRKKCVRNALMREDLTCIDAWDASDTARVRWRQAGRRGSRSLGREVRRGSCCSGAGASFFTDSVWPGNRETDAFLALKNGKNPPQSPGCSRCDRWDLVNDCDQLLRESVYIYFCRVTNDQRERKTAANALVIGCHQSNKSVGSLCSREQPYVGKFSCWNLGWPRRFVPRLRNVYRFCFLTHNI